MTPKSLKRRTFLFNLTSGLSAVSCLNKKNTPTDPPSKQDPQTPRSNPSRNQEDETVQKSDSEAALETIVSKVCPSPLKVDLSKITDAPKALAMHSQWYGHPVNAMLAVGYVSHRGTTLERISLCDYQGQLIAHKTIQSSEQYTANSDLMPQVFEQIEVLHSEKWWIILRFDDSSLFKTEIGPADFKQTYKNAPVYGVGQESHQNSKIAAYTHHQPFLFNDFELIHQNSEAEILKKFEVTDLLLRYPQPSLETNLAIKNYSHLLLLHRVDDRYYIRTLINFI